MSEPKDRQREQAAQNPQDQGEAAKPTERGRKTSPAQRVALFAMMTAMAFVLSLMERMIPPIAGAVPGVKLGLANVVVLIVLYDRGPRDAFAVSLLRVLIMGFVFSNMQTLLYSLAGGMLSFSAMFLCKKLGFFSVPGVSVAGAVFHNLGQILTAMLMLGSPMLIGYLPVLLIAGIGTGLATGLVANGVLRYLRRASKG